MSLIVQATWTATSSTTAAVRLALAEMAPLSRAEPGCRDYRVYQAADEPEVFHIFEVYDDEAAYLAHGASQHYREVVVERAVPLLVARARTFYSGLEL